MAALIVLVMGLSVFGMYAFNASIGMHSWFTAQQIWKNHRERLVNCARKMVRTGDVTKMEACAESRQFFAEHRRLRALVRQHKWDEAKRAIRKVGLNGPESTAALDLFHSGQIIPQVASAIEVWTAAIGEISQLEKLAADYRQAVRQAPLSARQRQVYLHQLAHIDQQLVADEDRFGDLLQSGAPMGRNLGIGSITAALLLLIGSGAYLGRLARRSERQRAVAERRLARHERTYHALVENLHEPVCAVDTTSGRVYEANPAFWRLVAGEEELPQGLFVHDFLDESPDRVEQYLRTLGEDRLHEKPWKIADDEVRIMQMTSCKVPGTDDQVYLLARDVTALREYEARMIEVDRMMAVGTLAAGVGHEINNPLTYVAGGIDFAHRQLAELLAAGPPTSTEEAMECWERLHALLPEVVEALGDAREGTGRVRDIVRDLRTFTRGEEIESIQVVDVEPIVELALDMAAHEIRHKAQLVRHYEPGSVVWASESRLAQVLLNLLINAAQAIDDGDVRDNEIGVRTRREGDEVVIEVRDTGKGITEEERKMVFEPFRTTKPVGEGTGLGLAISRHIVESMGGELTFESTPGVETTFTVRLPAGDAFAPDVPAASG